MGARSGMPEISFDSTTHFPTTLSASVNPAKAGPPAWVTPAVPSSAPMVVVPMMSLVLSPLDPALALADLVSSLRCRSTEIGFQRSLVAPSKLGVFLYLTEILIFLLNPLLKKKKPFLEKKKKKKKKK